MASITYPGQVTGTAPPAGSYMQNGQVFLPDGTPFQNPAATPTPAAAPIYLNLGSSPTSSPTTAPNVSRIIRRARGNAQNSVNAANYTPPEVAAQQQINQIDPGLLAASKQLENTYNSMISGRAPLTQSYAQDFLNAQAGQLPPGVLREIQQDARGTQANSGNYNGVSQAVQEGMTTGTAGYNYLTQARNNFSNYLQGVLGQTQSYLGGNTTPYALGSNYVNNAINQNSAAASGSQVPTYNPYANQAPAFSYINPNTGAEFAQGTTNFMNAGTGATPGSPDTLGQFIGPAIGAAGTATSALISSGALAGLGGALAAF